jgi:uncharacterized protein YaiL (DUF2058 family)
MGNSLQDQLLKAGLADAKQAKKSKAGKPPKKKKKRSGGPELSDSARAARQAMAEKAARDRELNQQRKAEAEQNALRAQVRQLIEQNRLDRDGGDLGYHFQDGTKLRKLYVTPAILDQLAKGRADVVRLDDGQYEVVPAEVAEKIRARDSGCVMPRNTATTEPDEDDPYKDFQVPDDLMW